MRQGKNFNLKNFLNNLIRDQTKYAINISTENFIFQHDNAAVHSAKTIKQYFSSENITVLNWLACSSNLNIIENY